MTRALARLKVKPQTLYAYVSRGQIRMVPDANDARRSLYSAEDVDGVATRKARGKKSAAIAAGSMAWGEPSITTGISTVHHGRLYYRGADAVALARDTSLEAVAALLWDVQDIPVFASSEAGPADPFTALAAMVPYSPPILGEVTAVWPEKPRRSSETLQRSAARYLITHQFMRGWHEGGVVPLASTTGCVRLWS